MAAERVGTFVFALSGGVAAVRRRMDILGVILVAFLPALGGGTIRDILLDQPVFWLEDTPVLAISALGGVVAFFAAEPVDNWKPLRWADAAGLSLFALAGAAKAADLGYGLAVILLMGMITATFGGFLRDVLTRRVPLIFKREIYATAALLGALVYALLLRAPVPEGVAFSAGMTAAFLLRGATIIFGLNLPVPKH
ncbi:MAG: trimeric intracellular cation channel family protein [Pseudomonadota bacterium]